MGRYASSWVTHVKLFGEKADLDLYKWNIRQVDKQKPRWKDVVINQEMFEWDIIDTEEYPAHTVGIHLITEERYEFWSVRLCESLLEPAIDHERTSIHTSSQSAYKTYPFQLTSSWAKVYRTWKN